MSIHYKQASGKDSLLGAWHAQVAETAAKTPWLVQELIRRKSELLPKFAAYYLSTTARLAAPNPADVAAEVGSFTSWSCTVACVRTRSSDRGDDQCWWRLLAD
ncbi:MAG: hypothetical protein AB7P69_23145 [Candidatus Binatia bacterium]